jgi:hypothetical protein
MSTIASPAQAAQLAAAASAAHLQVLSSEPAVSSAGIPTTRFTLALASDPGVPAQAKTTSLELSDAFDLGHPEFAAQLAAFLSDCAQRLRTPRPDVILTLGGLPLSYAHFEWPFHESTAGADTSLVHGEVKLEDGMGSPLFAKISAAMTITFREVVRAPEQPFAESFILNAVRKTFDQGQLELVKSGNRQPVPVTTRYFSAKQKKFIFNDTTEPQRRHFLAAKTYWLSAVLGGGAPIWLLDPRDAQYLNSTVDELKPSVDALVKEGLITLAADKSFATPTEALIAKKPDFDAELAGALAFIKPSFNESMRGGHTNM